MTRPPSPARPGDHDLYLLRVWYELDGDRPVWRASVRQPYLDARRHFTTPEGLLAFLAEHLGAGTDGAGPAP
ncbi:MULTISPECIES: hypothetical protein [Deinococcus]|uniref:Uncharacterized protein n=1 Tax=Deinococcus rufus TaxID=2136097 RepID=A0ABV7Z2J6_9DEIO|nr:hypothetical protein [Deinococcus sp. AB2017081]WQE95865.1 hypothetical protein U2P90_02985 [Deinococcus sp. AB2017081]